MSTNTAVATNEADEEAYEAQHPLVYGIGEQKVPKLLAESSVAVFINKAVEAAMGVEACLNVILANECAKDNAQSDADLILDRHTEQGLIYAALAAAYFITDSGGSCMDRMEARCKSSESGKHPSRF